MKVAIVHDWLTGMRGGEKVLEAILELFPKADLFTLLHVPGSVSPLIESKTIYTSWIQKIPNIARRYRHFLPLLPNAIERFNFSKYDLIVSSSHCVAKGIKKPAKAFHLSYVHAPMRYIWDRYDDYFGPKRSSWWVRLAAGIFRPFLQRWDRKVSTEKRINTLVANSHYIADQIQTHYGRQAFVIHPFVEAQRFSGTRQAGANYLMVTAFAPYKRVDLAIEAFNRLDLPLLLIGSGQDEERLKKLAGPKISFLGNLSNESVSELYLRCRALIFPGIEDFGITPLEAMAAGAPVIALNAGGVRETVTPETGILFPEQTVESLMEAVLEMEKDPLRFEEIHCRNRAAFFSKDKFKSEFLQILKKNHFA